MIHRVKIFCFLIGVCVTGNIHLNAQHKTIASEYLENARQYAVIYNGILETPYSSVQYESLPYLHSPEYTTGDVYYDGLYYPNQQIRLDLYKDQLTILVPEKLLGKIIDPNRISRATIYNKTFVYKNLFRKEDFKSGYYELLYDASKIVLYKKELRKLKKSSSAIRLKFINSVKYFIEYEDKYYEVKNKQSFMRIFPESKKEIDSFAKKLPKESKKDVEKVLTLLADYCNELISNKNK